MEQRNLGETNVKLPIIGFGCGPRALLMVSDDQAEQRKVITSAIDNGANYFDTAADYGDGKSEVNLGRILSSLKRSTKISTKVVLQESEMDDVKGSVLHNFDQSLDRLQVDHVDALMLHNRVAHSRDYGRFGGKPMLDLNDVFGPNGLVTAFEEIISSKRAAAVGFTALGGEPDALEELVDSGAFHCINASFNMLNPSAAIDVPPSITPNYGALIAKAASAGMGVMAIQPLAAGSLLGNVGLSNRAASLVGLCENAGETVVSIAVRYVISNPQVTSVVVGITTTNHVEEAVAAAARGPLSSELIGEIEQF